MNLGNNKGKPGVVKWFAAQLTGPHPFWSGLNRLVARAHPAVTEAGERRRAELLAWVSVVMAALFIVGGIFTAGVRGALDRNTGVMAILAGISVFVYILSRTRFFAWGGWLLTGSLVIGGYAFVLLGLGDESSLNSFIPLAFVLGSILLSPLALVFWVLVGTYALLFLPANLSLDTGTLIGIYQGIGALLWVAVIFRNSIERRRLSELRNANMELQQASVNAELSSRRIRTVLQNLNEGVGVTDPAGDLVEVNEGLLRLAGYAKPEAMVGKHISTLVAEADRDRLNKVISYGVDLGKGLEYTIVTAKDGQAAAPRSYSGEITVSPLQDEQGQRAGYVTVVRDITLQKQAAEAIRASEARQRQILDSIPASILISRLPSGDILYANQTMVSQFGLQPEQVDGQATPDLYADPADRDRLLTILSDQGKLDNFVARAKRQDNGQTFWGELSGRVIDFAGERALLTAILDVNARRQAEESLVARDEMLQKDSKIIGELSRSSNITSGDMEAALKEITEAVSRALGVARTSVWLYNETGDRIDCVDLYQAGTGHSRGESWQVPTYPSFFTALRSATTIAADDALAHPSTRELSLVYLTPLGINSTLHAPILLRGKMVGLLACEHTGSKRHWTMEEESFAASIVDFVTAAMEARERLELQQQIGESYKRRGAQVQLSTQIAQEISTATDLNELFRRVVVQVKERFGYYHAQLFRYDSTQDAVVVAASYGEVGEQMIQARHHLPMGVGVVGMAANSGETMLRSDVTGDKDWKPNPSLPDTRGELAVPIKLRGKVLGVLDVQSNQAGTLTQDDQILLEGLCGQVAVAIEDTRLRQEMEERLQELNSLYASMSRQGWESMNETAQTPGYVFDGVSMTPLAPEGAYDQADQPDGSGSSRAKTKPLGNAMYVVSPLAVHGGGQIGTLAVEDDPAQPLSQEDRAFVEQVAEQVALALESARLFAQTQNTLAETQSLYRFSEAISHGVDLNEIYATMARLATEGTGLTGSWVATYDKNSGGLTGVAGVNIPAQQVRAFVPLDQKKPANFAVLSRQTVIINDPLKDERYRELSREEKAAQGKAIAIPIIIGDDVQAVLAVTSRLEAADIGSREERLLQHIVTQASVSIQRAQLFTQIRDALINTQESEQLVRTIIDSTPDWIFVKDQEHRFRMVNRAYTLSLHSKAEDVIGKTDLELGFPEEQVLGNPEKGILGIWPDDAAVMASGQGKEIPNDMVKLDGEMHIFNTYKAPLRDADGKVWGVLGVSRDVTDRERVQATIAQRALELRTVAELGTQISAVLDPGQMLQTVADLVKESFALSHAHIFLLNEKGDSLLLAAGAGEVGRKLMAQDWKIPLGHEKSVVARAARTRQGVIVNDVLLEPLYMANDMLPNTRSEMAVPLMVGERMLGVLDVQSDHVNHFSDEDVSIQAVLASQVAVALQNARTYAQTQRQAEYEAMINSISQKIQSTTSVENALQVAVRELGRALGASRTSVQLSLSKSK